jgi:hypothetical protein
MKASFSIIASALIIYAIVFMTERPMWEYTTVVSINFSDPCNLKPEYMVSHFFDEDDLEFTVNASLHKRVIEGCQPKLEFTYAAGTEEFTEAFVIYDDELTEFDQRYMWVATIPVPERFHVGPLSPQSILYTFSPTPGSNPSLPEMALALRTQWGNWYVKRHSGDQMTTAVTEQWLVWDFKPVNGPDAQHRAEALVENYYLTVFREPAIVTLSALLGSLISILLVTLPRSFSRDGFYRLTGALKLRHHRSDWKR